MSEKISKLDEQVFEIIWEIGRKKAIKDWNNGVERTLDQEMKSCIEENELVQQLQNTYQVYLKNKNNSNKNNVVKIINYINKPTKENFQALPSFVRNNA